MLNLKQLTSTFLSTTKAAAVNAYHMTEQGLGIAGVAAVATTGVALAKSSKHTAKAAAAMSKSSERLAAWLYKHVPVQVGDVCSTCGAPAPCQQDGKFFCENHVPTCTSLPADVVQNMSMTGVATPSTGTLADIL